MEKENGNDYVRRTASFIRSHEHRLADAAIGLRRRAQGPTSVLGWIGLGSTEQPKKPLIWTEDPHHLFYLLMCFEGLGIDVGSLDVRVQNPSRPTSMSYLAMLALKDKSDVLSISSLRSTMSSVSMFSLGGGWFGRAEPANLDAEIKYIYSAFTKLPALRVRASGLKVVSELANDLPTDSAIPMDAFKSLQTLECHDIDPRTLMGWDLLSEGLRSLTVKRSGMEDVSDLFVDSVIDDKLRREGNPSRVARPRLVHRPPSVRSRHSSFHVAQLPPSVPEDSEETETLTPQDPQPERCIPSHAWSRLTHLSLSDNNLTFLPSFPPLPSLVSLDLSSNLLVSVPPSLSALPALKSLNLAHNMVDSVLGIYSHIPFIVALNIAANRLDSLCGLERLESLSRMDLRNNNIEDTDEIGRLAVLRGIKEVWVTGNPCTRRDREWRVRCFDLFAKEGKEVIIDGSPPGLMERRAMVYHVDSNGLSESHGGNGRPLSNSHPSPNTQATGASLPSPPSTPQTMAVHESSSLESPRASPVPSAVQSLASNPTPGLVPKARRRKNKRIVEFGDNDSNDELTPDAQSSRKIHTRHYSDVGIMRRESQLEGENISGPSATISKAPPVKDAINGTSCTPDTQQADMNLPSSVTIDGIPSLSRASTAESASTLSRTPQGANTVRTLTSVKSSKRRARLSPSMYEPVTASSGLFERRLEVSQSFGSPTSEAEVFRKRIEALRNEVGESWLKVLSHTHLGSPGETPIRPKS